jgi:hypothetical protein
MPVQTIEFTTPLQRAILERALLLAQELERTANAAPDGAVLRRTEQLILEQGREFLRQSLQATLQAQADAVEKKGLRPEPVRVDRRGGTKGTS